MTTPRDEFEQDVHRHLDELNKSPEFALSDLLQRMLRLIVDATLRGERAKRIWLMQQLYGGTAKSEGALSTEVRRLRKRLTIHYQSPDGVKQPFRLTIPPGDDGYVARIMRPDGTDCLEPTRTPRAVEIHIIPLNSRRGLISVFPVFSPNGRDIAFSWNRDKGGFAFDLFILSPGAAAPTLVTAAAAASILSPAWSPDSRQLAFLRASRETCEVCVVDVATPEHIRTIAEVFAARYELLGRHLSWMPDGDALLVVEKASSTAPFAIARLSLRTGVATPVTEPPAGIVGDSDPVISPDGHHLAFVRTEATGISDVFIASKDGTGPIRRTTDRRHLYGLTWRPDSHALVVSSDRTGTPSLWEIGLAGEEPQRVSGVDGRALHPAYSADGRIACSNLNVSTSIWEIARDPATASPRAPVRWISSSRNDVNPDFSPDGKTIAFASDRTGTFQIWTSNVEDSDLRQITSFNATASAGSPRWSPDGSQIAFDCRADGTTDIWIAAAAPVASTQVTRLTCDEYENVVPSWSRDGRWLYFSSNRTGQHEIWRLPSAAGDATQLTRGGGFGARESPDGRFLYYARGRTASGLWRMSLSDGREELILPALRAAFWGLWDVTHDGIFFLDAVGDGPPPGCVKFLDFASGAITQLAVLPDLMYVHYQGLAVSPDRARILYPQLAESAGEIMIVNSQ